MSLLSLLSLQSRLARSGGWEIHLELTPPWGGGKWGRGNQDTQYGETRES